MFLNIRELYSLLTRDQRNKLFRLQFLVIIMSIAEVSSVLSIGPFMTLIGDVSQLEGNGFLAEWYKNMGFTNTTDFLFFIACCVLVVLIIATVISMYTIWRLSMYAAQIGADLSSRLYRYYMSQPWLFHAAGNSNQLTNKIAQECERVTSGIITPLMQMNAKLFMAIIMCLAIFIYSPIVAIIGASTFYITYFFLYRTVRERLSNNGEAITEEQAIRFKLMGEGFGGIKDLLILGRQASFNNRFLEASKGFAFAKGRTQVLGQVPRYAVELMAFGAVISLIMYLLIKLEGNLGAILPVLSIFVLAGFKLLPAFQQIYFSLSQIRGNLSGLKSIRNDLLASINQISLNSKDRIIHDEHFFSKGSIELQNITFKYPETKKPAVFGLNIEIPHNKIIGLVGSSGSGKSTAVDILLGLITPDKGKVLIDGKSLSQKNLRLWQDSLGFVSQVIFLADASIRENIAFGINPENIDDKRIKDALKLSHLDEFVSDLPNGIDTRVGERGVQLSGGQRQRVGIARALYNNADVLIFDEATSALDSITEKHIMDAIHDFSGRKTIVMIAHRITTVEQCDIIYLIEDGEVADQGNYIDLSSRNKTFRKMAKKL
ncbi:MAG: multidrug ABC transporter ATP-binding protein [Flavobacteriales bacterium]|nr:multidrug ABC transporter ATP-binding protein [Flavobacteriales bacterium]|tara:strand:+ start:1907 stop:3712 length:1806 start_codon:yes stop_codon:yes gene_type:complete